MGLYKLERYSHEGYLIKVVAMALAGEVARELSPIRSWSNKDYDLKLAEKARERELQVWEATSADTFPFVRPAGAQKILSLPQSGHESTKHMGIFLQCQCGIDPTTLLLRL